jgi:DNA modification methylase
MPSERQARINSRRADLRLGDCLEVMETLADGSVDLVLTDIPYGEVNRKDSGLRKLDKGAADILTFELAPFLSELDRVCSGTAYVFCGTEQVSEIRAQFVLMGWTTRLGIWEKTNPSPMNGQHLWLSGVECCVFGRKKGATFNAHCKNSVWRFPNGSSKVHPTQKPLPLFQYLLETSSAQGQTVLDPCMGSGTTGVAAARAGRAFIGIERDPGYFAIATQRIEDALPIDLFSAA